MSRMHKNLFLLLRLLDAFPFLLSLLWLILITSSRIELKMYAIAAGIKMYKSIIKKKEKKQDETVLLGKSKLNSIEVVISHALIDWNNSHDEFVLINNVLKKYDHIKEERSIFKDPISLLKILVYLLTNVQKVKIQKFYKQKTEE